MLFRGLIGPSVLLIALRPVLVVATLVSAGVMSASASPLTVGGPDSVAPAASARPPAERATVSTADEPTLERETILYTRRALLEHEDIARRGGWPAVPGSRLSRGQAGPAVAALRERLVASGDLPPSALDGRTYDTAVVKAVRRFQMRHGLTTTGEVGPLTMKALNVPADTRVSQLRAAVSRLTVLTFGFGPRYVVVNIPAAAIEAVENGSVALRRAAIVGRPDRPSPELVTRLTVVNLNPTWTVPNSIIKKDIIPKMIADRGWLARNRMKLLDGAGREIPVSALAWSPDMNINFTVRQEPGPQNALGQTRIDMPNAHSVFLHDTPAKGLFTADLRYASSGCVRVDGVRDLAAWVLAGQPGSARADIDRQIATNARQDIRVARPVPVVWTYLTGWGTRDGLVHFRDDIYGLDDGAQMIAAPPPAAAAGPPVSLEAPRGWRFPGGVFETR
jgi:murein L,D-transpeptidase YcbB/YkuD